MSQELFNTSAAVGARPGASGFCTVAVTANFPPLLEQRLTLLSGYRWIYPAGEANADKNPVVWAHWRVPVGGRTYSVLSRVGDAGMDYSGRSNRLAHHLVVEPSEQTPAGPAWLLMQPGLLESTWRGEPQVLATGRRVPEGENPPRRCVAWKAAGGDAGWAGVLAESFLEDPSRLCYVLFTPGTELLPLFDEALALLPPARRWDVTFSTYFTELPAGLTCNWRGCAAGSRAAADALRAGSAARVIDLTRPLATAPDTAGAMAARGGWMIPEPRFSSGSRMEASPELIELASEPDDEAPGYEPTHIPEAVPLAPVPPPLSVAEAPAPSAGVSPDQSWMPPVSATVIETERPGVGGSERRGVGKRAIAGLALASIAVLALGWSWFMQRGELAEAAERERKLRELQSATLVSANTMRSLPGNPNATQPALSDALAKAGGHIAELTAERDTLRQQLASAQSELSGVDGKEKEILRLRDALETSKAQLASLVAVAPATAPATHPTTHSDPAVAAADVFDDRIILWAASPAAEATPDRIELQAPATPASLAVMQGDALRIVLRVGGKGADATGVTVADLASIQWKNGRLGFSWQDKRRLRDIPGAADWLAVSRVRVLRKNELLTTVQLVLPQTIRFPLSEQVTVLPELHGVTADQLSLSAPTPPVGWMVHPAANAAALDISSAQKPNAHFQVTIDLSGVYPLARSTFLERQAELTAKKDDLQALAGFGRLVVAVRDRRTDVVLCHLLLEGPAAPKSQ